MKPTLLATLFLLFGCANGTSNPTPVEQPSPDKQIGPSSSSPSATPAVPAKSAGPTTSGPAAEEDSLIRGRSDGDSVTLSGFLFHYPDAGTYELCDHMCESYPPQCCGPHVPLIDVGDKAPKLSTAEHNDSVAWADTAVTVKGTVTSDSVSVADID